MKRPLCITSPAHDMRQGLFGQTFYYLLQILPYLDQQSIYPRWEIATEHYGSKPDSITVPGVLDLVYTPSSGPYRHISLEEVRRRHAHVLGNDWHSLHHLWTKYFRLPQRIVNAATGILPRGRVLGIHFRGTDKQTATWDSNPISPAEYLTLVRNFVAERGHFDAVFAATDEFGFVQQLEEALGLPVLNMGEVGFHMAADHTMSGAKKADRAMLDCLLLSQCSCVLETSSALPSFAKLLNPSLEIYRCAASKLFGKLYTKMPYFPVAHVPVIPLNDPVSSAILARTMKDDWTLAPETAPFREQFTAVPRWKRNHTVFKAAERLGMDRILGRLMPGHL